MKKLGFGLMRLPLLDGSERGSIDIEQAKKMTDMFLERGFTYFDTAWMYHDFKSEEAVKEILTDRYPRERYQLATKLHADYFDSRQEMEEVFSSQLTKTNASYFDFYLLHDTNRRYYEKYSDLGCFEWLEAKKEQGLVKHMGFSFHDGPDVLDQILTEHPEMEFVQLQINYLDWESSDVQSRANYEVARAHGTPIIIMEPVKGGILSMLPYQAEKLMKEAHPDWSCAEWAVKFAAGLDGVMMVLSGMSSLKQMDDNTSYMSDFEGLTDADKEIIAGCVDIINKGVKIPCTGCGYCTDGCAAAIPVPTYMSLFNAANKGKALEQKKRYDELIQKFPPASSCVGCGQCELICPQHLPVKKHMAEIAEYFEGDKA